MSNKLRIKILNFKFGTWEAKQVSGRNLLNHAMVTALIMMKTFNQIIFKITLCYHRPYWRCYYSNTDAIIYVVDSADRDRMGISKQELVSMLEVG